MAVVSIGFSPPFFLTHRSRLSVWSGQVLSSRPHPEWSLKRLGNLLYGRASVAREGWVAWSGTEQERQALIAIPELAMHEWKDALLDPDIEMTRDY